MNEKMIPYFCHEGDMARAERTIKRLWILCIMLIVLLVGTNVAWIYYESQFEEIVETTQEITQENSDGINNFVGRDGVITNGETNSQN